MTSKEAADRIKELDEQLATRGREMSDTMYKCDNWVVIKMKGDDPHYRLLVGTSGGYLDGDSWRMNSGITRHEFDGDYWYFYGSSGSCYKCYVDSYCLRMNNAHIWNRLQELHGDKVEMLEDQAWIKKDWDWIISSW